MKCIIELEFGETTCASIPGKFCEMVRVSNFGQKYSCGLFCCELFNNHPTGWLQRCSECLKRFPPNTKDSNE